MIHPLLSLTSAPDSHCQIVLPRSEVDFPLGLGILLLEVEIKLGLTIDESVPSLVPEAEATPAEPSTMGLIVFLRLHEVPVIREFGHCVLAAGPILSCDGKQC